MLGKRCLISALYFPRQYALIVIKVTTTTAHGRVQDFLRSQGLSCRESEIQILGENR